MGVWVEDGLAMADHFRACAEGFAPRDTLMEYLIHAQSQIPANIRRLTNPNRWPESRALFAKYPWAESVARLLVERIVQVEEKRGELPTDLTGHAQSIEHFEGAEHFCRLLAALGKESFFRGYEYSHDTTKEATLSRLLKRCYPAKEDSPERLAELLKQTDISEKRLAEAVMYAPQWAGFAEKILGWPGLKCGVWFFHAHINETFSAEKETEVAIYSPISPQQFNDGAFDKNWFLAAYGQLGEKRFQILYKSAKYITSGSNPHRRACSAGQGAAHRVLRNHAGHRSGGQRAHAGGVDPEASHSTVEMRTAIAAELVQLLRLHNVSWLGAHAKIQGKLGNYSVHMGSGIVHAEGKGMIAILPVHSQARGRIFLPFADDDPKTAEIMSKIILLAGDDKIKDPMILDQICT